MLAKVFKKTMKENIKKLHAQRTVWKSHGRNSLCKPFYYCKNV
jgi:hypothetical protein